MFQSARLGSESTSLFHTKVEKDDFPMTKARVTRYLFAGNEM